jgi:DNA-binding MarR family transcriptional regulator
MVATGGAGNGVSDEAADRAARLAELGSRLSAATVSFNARVARRAGLSTTDHKCLELARASELRLTAGQIAEESGLSTGAVTGVIDRLERAGFVRRVRDPADRRKVLVEVSRRRLSEHPEATVGLAEVLERLLPEYDADELDVVERYNSDVIAALTDQ